jgi:hypothetical protein
MVFAHLERILKLNRLRQRVAIGILNVAPIRRGNLRFSQ